MNSDLIKVGMQGYCLYFGTRVIMHNAITLLADFSGYLTAGCYSYAC